MPVAVVGVTVAVIVVLMPIAAGFTLLAKLVVVLAWLVVTRENELEVTTVVGDVKASAGRLTKLTNASNISAQARSQALARHFRNPA